MRDCGGWNGNFREIPNKGASTWHMFGEKFHEETPLVSNFPTDFCVKKHTSLVLFPRLGPLKK